jgi:argininosuccinate synthase
MREETWRTPGMSPKEDVLMIITPPEKAPDRPTYVEIEFEKGHSH